MKWYWRSSNSEGIAQTVETTISQFDLQELEKQKAKLAIDQEKEETNLNKAKSHVKRMSKLANRSSRENDRKKNSMLNNFGDGEKE